MSRRQVQINQARSTQRGALAQNQNRPAKKKSRRSRNRRGNVKSPAVRPSLHLSQCAADYAKAKLAPFAYADNSSPCIPDLLDLPSQKFFTLQRGEATIGTSGVGFVLTSPFCNNNEDYSTWYSSLSFAGTHVPTGTATTGCIGLLDAQFPWGANQTRNVRTVACGLRVRYTGTELYRGGRLVLAQNKNAAAATSFANHTLASLMARPESQSFPVDRSWRTISWNPGYPEAFEYTSSHYPLGTAAAHNGKLLAMFQGSSGNTFEFEIITYHEAVSKGPDYPVQNVTKSHSDPVGLGLVKDFLSESPDNVMFGGGDSAYKEFLKFALKGAAAAATTYFTGSPGPGLPLLLHGSL